MSQPGKEIRVSGWTELVAALHSPQIIPLCPEQGNHRRAPYVFRGMDDATWELTTTLQRLPKEPATDIQVIERASIRSFRKYASAGTFDQKSEWYVLAVAQHNGLPQGALIGRPRRWWLPISHAQTRHNGAETVRSGASTQDSFVRSISGSLHRCSTAHGCMTLASLKTLSTIWIPSIKTTSRQS